MSFSYWDRVEKKDFLMFFKEENGWGLFNSRLIYESGGDIYYASPSQRINITDKWDTLKTLFTSYCNDWKKHNLEVNGCDMREYLIIFNFDDFKVEEYEGGVYPSSIQKFYKRLVKLDRGLSPKLTTRITI